MAARRRASGGARRGPSGRRGAGGGPGARTAGEVARRHFATIGPDASLFDAYQLMRMARLRHVMVTNGRALRGTLSYRDLLERFLLGEEAPGDPREVRVGSVMVDKPYTLAPDDTLQEAASRMLRLHVGCLPVVAAAGPSELELVGIVTESDLLRAAYAGFEAAEPGP